MSLLLLFILSPIVAVMILPFFKWGPQHHNQMLNLKFRFLQKVTIYLDLHPDTVFPLLSGHPFCYGKSGLIRGWPLLKVKIQYYFTILVHLKSVLIRKVVLGGREHIRGGLIYSAISMFKNYYTREGVSFLSLTKLSSPTI